MNNDQYAFIRGALRVNAGFSVLTGLALLILPGVMANLLGLSAPAWIPAGLGAGLLSFAAYVWWVAGREELSIKMVNTVSAMDVIWVLASAEILIFDLITVSAAGRALVVITALFVALFAAAQITGVIRLKRARSEPSPRAI